MSLGEGAVEEGGAAVLAGEVSAVSGGVMSSDSMSSEMGIGLVMVSVIFM